MKETYADARRRLVERQARLNRMRAEKRALEEKITEVTQRAYWFTALVRPLAIELKRETGASSYLLGGPFGLNSEWYIHLVYEDGRQASLSGTYGGEEDGLRFHTGERADAYAKGTLGKVNGMNRVTAPLPLAAAAIVPLLHWKEAATAE
jgi:hypothetical protein